MSVVQSEIEARLAESEPDIEVLLAEIVGGRCLRVFIDHPDGVNLAMCERVTLLLNDLRERYSLEVSSRGASARSPSPRTSAASSGAARGSAPAIPPGRRGRR